MATTTSEMTTEALRAEFAHIDPQVEEMKRTNARMTDEYRALRARRIAIESELWARANPAEAAASRAACATVHGEPIQQQAQMQQQTKVTTPTDKAQALLDTPGAVTLHHGHGIARVYTVIGSRGAVYRTSDATCDCPAGLNGRRCYHLDAVALLQAAEGQAPVSPAADPFTGLDTFATDTDAMAEAFTSGTPATPADHAVTIATAAELLTVKPATVSRYLRAGRLIRLDAGISAASITAYATTRTASRQRARNAAGHFLPTPTAEPVDDSFGAHTTRLIALLDSAPSRGLAAQAFALAAELEKAARLLKDAARPVADQHGPGQGVDFDLVRVAGRMIQDSPAVKAHYAQIGEPIPMRQAADSWKGVPTSA